MSARITISYETERELREVTDILSPVMKKCKISKRNIGISWKALVELKYIPERNYVCDEEEIK